MALEIGASPFGDWSGCHACGWDRNAPEFGELAIGDQFEKDSDPLGILVNADGRRFVDEAPTSTASPTPSTAARSSSSPGSSPGRSLMRRCSTSCALSTTSSA
jgi:hypothetical protein